LFNSPDVLTEVARENNIELSGTVLFFYEVYELQFDSGKWTARRYELQRAGG